MDAAITDTVTLAQIKHGGELIDRYEKRDLDWFIEVTNQAEWPRLRSAPATDRDYLRLLALYKLGVVIEATADTPSRIIIMPAVDALMESLESLVLADLLPEPPSMEQLIEEAWKAGLTPEPVPRSAQGPKAKPSDGQPMLDTPATGPQGQRPWNCSLNTYRTKEEAYRIISAQVCGAPGTIKNWIAGIPKDSPPE
ncbi:MAG: hypothetical protein R3E56_16670 [Burkholderiaceae bacterium]